MTVRLCVRLMHVVPAISTRCESALIRACGITKLCDERGQFSVAVVMKQRSVAMHDNGDGT